MRATFKPYEIDHQTLKFIVGVIALSLGNLTEFLANDPLESISAAYHDTGPWARDFLVGFLFAICAFLLAYNGQSTLEAVLSKIAAVAAIGVALFPCGCKNYDQVIPHVHYISAAIMFLVLACFCGIFYKRARKKGRREALWRSYVYAVCGIAMLVAIGLLVVDFAMAGAISASVPRLVFYCERAGLVAFGVSWLVASKVLPIISAPDERTSIVPLAKS